MTGSRFQRCDLSGSGVQRDVEQPDEEMGEINYVEVENLIGEWVMEVQQLQAEEKEEEENIEKAWDDVRGGELPIGTAKGVGWKM